MPRKKKTDATGASTGNPASSTASQRPAKRRVASRFQAMATPARLSPATNAEQNLPAAASQPATAATREPETASVEPLTMFPGALFSGAAAISTVEMTAVASTVTLDPGLAAVDIRIPPIQPYTLGQVSLPLIWLSQPAAGERDRVQIFSASGRDDNWLPPSGDLIVVRSPPTGGQLTVTVFGPPGQPVQAASITVRRLTRAELNPTSAASAPMAPARTSPEKDVRLEVLAHIERRGDQIFPGTGWVGNRGSRLRIEGFVIRPLNELTPSDIEYQMLGPDGSEGPWVRSPQFCGTRGRGLRITGFAVRVSPRLQDRVAVEYYGAFFDSGISGPFKNGEACQPSLPGDTLEAINVRVTRRG
jgi:hypothetical protein